MDDSSELRVLAVDNADGPLNPTAGSLGFDVQLSGGETRLVVALSSPERALALFHVAGDRTDELARGPLEGARRPLFCGGNVLVYGRITDGSCWCAQVRHRQKVYRAATRSSQRAQQSLFTRILVMYSGAS